MIKKIKSYLMKDKRVFAKGVCKEKVFFIFLIGCIIGCYYEQILNLIVHYFQNGSIFWETRRGVIYGPFSPIYGGGAAILTLLFCRKEYKSYQIFLYGALFGGSFEYLISFLQELVIGTVSWDYSGYFLNINGRTTIPYMAFWGLATLLFCKVVYPFCSNLLEKIPYRLGKILYISLAIFMILNMLISWTALFRQTMRRENKKPYTVIGEFYDKVYTDERLQECFANMVAK